MTLGKPQLLIGAGVVGFTALVYFLAKPKPVTAQPIAPAYSPAYTARGSEDAPTGISFPVESSGGSEVSASRASEAPSSGVSHPSPIPNFFTRDIPLSATPSYLTPSEVAKQAAIASAYSAPQGYKATLAYSASPTLAVSANGIAYAINPIQTVQAPSSGIGLVKPGLTGPR